MGKSAKKSSLVKSLAIATVVFGLFIIIANLGGLIDKVVIKTTKINNYKILSDYLLAQNKPLGILLLFENNSEVRHGGGFIGTVGFIDIEKGAIKPKSIRSVYYYDHKAEAPGYYEETTEGSNGEKVMNTYTLRNSGVNMDWPRNARRAANIFEKESGMSVDMVVGITPDILKSMLQKTGPIYLPDYRLTITADNIMETLQMEVESGTDKAQRDDPKSVITSLANKLMGILSQKSIGELYGYLPDIDRLLRERQIVAYSKDLRVEQAIKDLGYSGGLKAFSGDYMGFSESSGSGTKTGSYIKRDLSRQTTISDNGESLIDITFEREHLAMENLYRYFDPEFNGYKYLVGYDQVDIKLALPKGSEIISSSGSFYLTDRENGYDIYIFGMTVQPSEKKAFNIRYKQPYRQVMGDTFNYTSYLQMPMGTFGVGIKDCVQVPKDYVLLASNKPNFTNSLGNVCYDADTSSDYFLSLVYGKK